MDQPKSTTGKKSALEQWLNRKKPKAPKQEIIALDESLPTPLTYSQNRMWLLQKLFPDNRFYQYGHIYRFEGTLDTDLLQKSFDPLTEKYSILRTTFQDTPDGPRQVAEPGPPLSIDLEDITHISPDQQTEEAKQIIERETNRSFDLSQGPLLRLRLIKFAKDKFWLIVNMHHIIIDRWSLDLMNREVSRQYLALKKGETAPITPLPFQYSDYARWQQSQPIDQKALDYWLKKLSGELPSYSLPTDFPRPTTPSFRGRLLGKQLSTELTEDIRALSKANQTTMYVLILAAFKTLLYRYADLTDILVGSPFSNRDKTSLEEVAGLFNETLVLRTELSPDMSFQELIQAVKTTTLEALAHKDVPFDTLVQKLNPERLGSNNPLFQVMFSYKTMVPPPSFGDDIKVEEDTLDLGISKFDLILYGLDEPDHLTLDLVYAEDLYKASTGVRILDQIGVILAEAVKNPSAKLAQIPLLTETEEHQILQEWNDTQAIIPTVPGIHHFLEKHAKLNPDQSAVIYLEDSLTYAELNERANNIARRLLQSGVRANEPVGLYCQRSVEMLVGIFGILKAGAAYLPLDPEYPAERISFMLTDSKARLVLSQEKLVSQLETISAIEVLGLESCSVAVSGSSDSLPVVETNQLAYIIYTSGSTGLPKGVPITHQNLIHSTTARFDFYVEDPSCFLLLSSFSFDSSVAGIFWTICSGGTLLLPKRRIEQDIDSLANLIYKHQVSHTLLLPSLYSLLLTHAPAGSLESLHTVMVAGEACNPRTVEQHFKTLPTSRLYNEYGPTEATVWCIAHQIGSADQGMVPIGKPISNTQVYILDKYLQIVPIGVIGELYIAGAGLATEYLNRPELTEERFISNSFSADPSAKMYKTGDLARYREDGTIEFFGRADHQVKIRGHRVEPDEITALLVGLPKVQEAVVIVHQPDSANSSQLRLVAYLSGIANDEVADLRNLLRDRLPDYMVPAAIITLDALPHLPNGKIDRKALPSPENVDLSEQFEYQEPSSELEIQLAKIWQEVLQIEKIGVNDNFFEIGGDSILSIQIVAKARNAELPLAANQLFEHQTIATLARSMEVEKGKQFSSLVSLQSKGKQQPLFCIHSGGAHVFFYNALAKHLAPHQPVYALQPLGLDNPEEQHESIEEMAAHYLQEIRTVQPEGPYLFLGTCFSNAVVLEMADQLYKETGIIAELFIIDSGPVHLFGDAKNGQKATIKRFWDMLKRGDFHRIKSKLSSRLKLSKKVNEKLERIRPEKELMEMIGSLSEAYSQYNWPSYPGKLQFIRSSEFHQRPDKKYHLYQWKKLAKGGVDVHVVPGHHLTLFEEPEVQGLAEKLGECLGVSAGVSGGEG